VTLENGEGSNACALPCGVGGVGGSVGGVGNEENRPVARPAHTQALHHPKRVVVIIVVRTLIDLFAVQGIAMILTVALKSTNIHSKV